MALTKIEIAQLAINFPAVHANQIAAKAMRYRESVADVSQVVSLIILERGETYDVCKGSFEQFIFGNFEALYKRKSCAHRFAISLDQPGDECGKIRSNVESQSKCTESDGEAFCTSTMPWARKVNEVANLISGYSTAELAPRLGVTPRRVRQLIQDLCNTVPGSTEFDKQISALLARLGK